MLVDLIGMHRVGPVTLSGAPLVITHAKLQALHTLWLQQRAQAALPRGTNFDFRKLKPWLGHIALVDVLREPLQFRFRLYGTYIVGLASKDHTGKWLDRCFPKDRVKVVLDPYYECVERRAPVALADRYSTPGGQESILEQLFLPCSSDRSSIDLIVGAVYLEHEGQKR